MCQSNETITISHPTVDHQNINMHVRDVREWLSTFPFPIPIYSIPIPSHLHSYFFFTYSHSHGIPVSAIPIPPIPILSMLKLYIISDTVIIIICS